MLPTLGRSARRVTASAAAAAVLAALTSLPFSVAPFASAQDGAARANGFILAQPSADPSPPDLRAARDPFVPDRAVVAAQAGGLDIRVGAVALGASPRALVTRGDRTFVVRVGDAIDGMRVERIDALGVHLPGLDLPLAASRP